MTERPSAENTCTQYFRCTGGRNQVGPMTSKKIFSLWRKIEDLFFLESHILRTRNTPPLITYSIFYSMPKSLVPIDFWLVPSKKFLKNKKTGNGLCLLNFDLYLSNKFERTTSKLNSRKPFPDIKHCHCILLQ